MPISAGLVLYRFSPAPEVLLVHPGGPFWARKDLGAWSIPKGLAEEGEDPLTAAHREFEEETGHKAHGELRALVPRRQKSGKVIHAFAVQGNLDPAAIKSITFEMEWPPRSGKMKTFPEIDRAGWFGLDDARARIVPGQVPILDELELLLATPAP